MTAPSDAESADYFQVKLDAAALKASSVKGTFLFGSAQVFRIFLQLGSQIALARLLFPADFGLVAMVSPVVSFAAIFSAGFGEAVVQRSHLHQAQVSALFWLNMAISCLATIILMAISPLAALTFGEPRVTLLMIVIAVSVPIGALGAVQSALLTRHMQFKTIVGIELASVIIGTALTILTAWAGWSYWSLAVGAIAQASSATVMSWIASDWRPSRPRYAATLKSDMGFGANVTGYNLATFITTSGDNIIIGVLNGEKALGLYDRSYRLVVAPVSQAIAPIGRVAVPLLSRLVDDPEEYRRVFLVAVQIILLITVPAMLVCVMHGPEIVHVLLGPRWVEAGELLSWISVGGLASGLHSTALWLFVSQARMRGLRQMTIIGAVLNLASFAVGSLWGIRGVAIGAGLVFTLVTTPLIMFGATRRGPISPGALLRTCAPFIAAGAIGAVVLRMVQRAAPLPEIPQIAVALVVAYALFAAAALATAEQRRNVLALIRMFRRPKVTVPSPAPAP